MPTGIPTNRTNIALPTDIAQEIIAKTVEESAIMRLARRINLPGRGVTIPMITADPEAAWVAETNPKPASNPSLSSKIMQGYTLAVIVPFSKQFLRDARSLYDELIRRLPAALGTKFDKTVIGAADAPGENFDRLVNCTTQSLVPDTNHSSYDALVAADTDIAVNGGLLNGFALSPQARGILLNAVDSTGRPLFVNNVAEGAIQMILGARTLMNRGLYKAGAAPVGTDAGTPAIVGIAGDWTKAMWGAVGEVAIDVTDQATITVGSGTDAQEINLWQRNMVAVRAEIEVGFRCDTSVFNLLAGEIPTT